MNGMKSFYNDLCTKRTVDDSRSFFNDVNLEHKKLSPEQRASCEGPLTLQECTHSLHSMPSDKSPRSDELTTEVCRTFWDETGLLVLLIMLSV